MSLDLTRHARGMLVERGILEAWVEQTVLDPETVESDRLDPALEHCLRRIPENENRVLRVVVNRSLSPHRVITAYFDRNARVAP